MAKHRPITRLANRSARWLACAAVAALLLLAVGTVADIVLRYVFARPIRGFVDIASLAGAVLLAACFPYVLTSRGNIAIDALGSRLGGRARRVLDRFAAVVSAGFFGVMAWQYLRFAAGLKDEAQTIPVLRWPVWPWWAAVAVSVLLAAVLGLLMIDPAREEES
jgi:TRAP-type C4-dicarboxylate transport system permease small subunit